MKIIGIDPGLDGGICIMIDGTIVNLIQMPVYTEVTKKKLKDCPKTGKKRYQKLRHIDVYKFADILFAHKGADIYMEKVNPFAGMNSASSTRMAISIGKLQGVMIGMGMKFNEVTPTSWQKELWQERDRVMRANPDKKTKQGNTDTKKTSLNAALRLFPTVNFIPKGKKVPHDGLFDSALIAEYGRRQ